MILFKTTEQERINIKDKYVAKIKSNLDDSVRYSVMEKVKNDKGEELLMDIKTRQTYIYQNKNNFETVESLILLADHDEYLTKKEFDKLVEHVTPKDNNKKRK